MIEGEHAIRDGDVSTDLLTVTRRHGHTRTGDLDGVENLVGVRGPADPNCGRYGREALATRVPRLVLQGIR